MRRKFTASTPEIHLQHKKEGWVEKPAFEERRLVKKGGQASGENCAFPATLDAPGLLR